MSQNNKKTNPREMRSQWPDDGLESVPICPICGSKNRTLLHEGLTDKVFFSALGIWTMYCCKCCACAYLDPRPTPETIHLAYQNYYTHDKTPSLRELNFRKRLRRKFANGYRNFRYGTQDHPASIFGVLAAALMPGGRAIIDAGMRHLPKIKAGNRLLDIGCGNGAFLLRARSAGWTVTGVDFDSRAVDTASSHGLDVRIGGIESMDSTVEQFDVITLAHIIEHVHQPVNFLQKCFNLLKPNGFLWIETPNIAAQGHKKFGAHWRGLEPPRHLVLFTLKSLCKTLKKIGFTNIEIQPYRPLCYNVFVASNAISANIDPYSVPGLNGSMLQVKKAERLAKQTPESREFITVKAWKKL